MSTFLEVPLPTGDKLTAIKEYLDFDNMRKNPNTNGQNLMAGIVKPPEDIKFLRKGIVSFLMGPKKQFSILFVKSTVFLEIGCVYYDFAVRLIPTVDENG